MREGDGRKIRGPRAFNMWPHFGGTTGLRAAARRKIGRRGAF